MPRWRIREQADVSVAFDLVLGGSVTAGHFNGLRMSYVHDSTR
jgi:hypothetical protein